MPTSKCPKGHFTILYFASAASYTKRDSEHLEAPLDSSKLFDKLEERHPGIRQKVLNSCAVTRNLQYIDLDDETEKVTIGEADEIGIIPPVSSG